jgi:hypothetical protein
VVYERTSSWAERGEVRSVDFKSLSVDGCLLTVGGWLPRVCIWLSTFGIVYG